MANMYFLPTDYNFPNLIIEGVYNAETNAHINYRVTPAEGYVFYDTNANDVETDPDTGEEIPVIYYKVLAYIPKNFNFDNFPYVAVLRSSVDENYIFGGGNDTETEVM